MLDNGEIVQAPSGDEPMPAEEGSPLTLPPSFDAIHCIKDPRCVAQIDVAPPNAQTLRRPGDPLDAPSPKEARTPRDSGEPTAEGNPREYGLPPGGDRNLKLDVAQEDRAHANSHPLLGWPDIARLFRDNGGAHLAHSVFDAAPYCKLGPEISFPRELGVGRNSIAVAEAGAVHVHQRGVEHLHAGWTRRARVSTSEFALHGYKLPNRRARDHPNVNCR